MNMNITTISIFPFFRLPKRSDQRHFFSRRYLVQSAFAVTTWCWWCFPMMTTLQAAESAGLVAIEVDQAGPDFLVQGEYLTAENITSKLGVQVIANGKGTFTAMLLPGGLPGAGWDGKTRQEATGKTSGVETVLNGEAGKLVINGDALTVTDANGKVTVLKKALRQSPTIGLKPPAGAVVLFDGSNTDAWNKGKIETVAGEKVLACGPETNRSFTSYQLHLEFRTPFKPEGKGQDRGNSGVYIHHTYEFQVLDSFGLVPEKNYAGALYTQVSPLVNACFPPLTWQTYDIDFTGPQFDAAGAKTANAKATVKLNGIVVQDHLDIPHGTGANTKRPEKPEGGPLWLQDHQNPVFFRNVWLLEKK
jgi:Domain of Unknown Function (DUF1080)